MLTIQKKQVEWHEMWSMLTEYEFFLFNDWIYPNTLNDFKDREVLECGCGGGDHTAFLAPFARHITAVDLNTSDIARNKTRAFDNVKCVEADIATMALGKQFDIVFSVGVIHHTDNPDKTFENLKKHVKVNGRLIVWVYSEEGNFLVKYGVEFVRRSLLRQIKRTNLLSLSKFITVLLYIPVFSIYPLPFRFLPYYEYFSNFRKLSFLRNAGNVFDKLNAPQTEFISKKRINKWFAENEFYNVHISSYKGVSWRGSGIKK